MASGPTRFRWVICALLFFSTTVNYMDRQVISYLKDSVFTVPAAQGGFGWTNRDFSYLTTAFTLFYGCMTLGMGWVIDRIGTRLGLALSLIFWSLCGIANAFAGRISYNLNIYGNMWEQVAKFRAGRNVWAHNLREKYGITKDSDLMLKGLFAGGGSGLMKAEPENNIMRGAFYGLAAALSGAQSTALCSFDEAYSIPTERSALLGLRTLQIIMEEVGLRDTVDPLAGSYFVETITKQMEEKIWEEMKEIEARGGMLSSVKDGFVGRKLARQAYEWEMGIEHGELIKVGVNKYVTGREEEVQLHEYNDRWQVDQIAAIKEVRRTRDAKQVSERLKALASAAKEGKNVMPALKECCLAYCTVGEMSDVFLDVFGPYIEPNVI